MSTGELACTYACLILHDDAIAVTSEKIGTLVKAANVNIESYWASLFSKLCEKRDIGDLIMNVGVASGGAVGAPAAVSAESDGATAAPAAEEKKEEKEDSDDDNMFSLFD